MTARGRTETHGHSVSCSAPVRTAAVPASPSCLSLWCLARDNGLRSRSACDGRRREDREVGVAALKSIEANLAIANGGELTAQETWRGAVLGCRRESV